jgi:hypothetical protein
MKIIRFIFFFILLLASICWTGCEVFARHSSPLVGWKGDDDEQPNQVIVNDYQNYLQKLPSNERNHARVSDWVKDGTGQHAIVIELALNGTWWYHVLIYDKDNKRIKVIKYVSGHYSG